uniref:Uncharacterized protein n=1 Tax=Anopheles culicifacies TaxID=139723 RepID=A0A182MA82_9DIPT
MWSWRPNCVVWWSALVTLLVTILCVSGVIGYRQDHDDMSVEEMLRRESRDVDQTEHMGPMGWSGVKIGDETLPVVIRKRPRRTKQTWRQHRPRHSGRQDITVRVDEVPNLSTKRKLSKIVSLSGFR